MIFFLFRRPLCYDISLHSDIELTKEVLTKIKDKRIVQDSPVCDHIGSLAFPVYPVVTRQGSELILSEMEWSLDPFYEKNPIERRKRRTKMSDIQSERVLGYTRSYAHRIRQTRCLIPVTGTYEHRAIPGWAKKVPYYIWPKDRNMQFLPGLFQIFESIGPVGKKTQSSSFGMLTRAVNKLMANVHNEGEFRHRMPLFLTPELEYFWLSEHFTDADVKAMFEYMLPSDALDYRTVFSIRGTKPRPDRKPKYDLWSYQNLPPQDNEGTIGIQFPIF